MKRCVVMMAAAFAGCGPMVSPMVPRLDAVQQKTADEEWHNLVTPPERADRDVLFVALTFNQLFQTGVDRADFHSEKKIDDKRVVMDIHFWREAPNEDAFYVTIYDHDGAVLRAERYSRDDYVRLNMKLLGPGAEPRPDWPETAEDKAAREAHAKFRIAIEAATRPAGWVPETQPAARP
jgi:hypothetical protein